MKKSTSLNGYILTDENLIKLQTQLMGLVNQLRGNVLYTCCDKTVLFPVLDSMDVILETLQSTVQTGRVMVRIDA